VSIDVDIRIDELHQAGGRVKFSALWRHPDHNAGRWSFIGNFDSEEMAERALEQRVPLAIEEGGRPSIRWFHGARHANNGT